MDIFSALILISAIILASSYAWGMRGTTIGGEKGAMLPGAIIGTLLALFSGILIVQENFHIFSALGAIGMYFGGCMTYGETLSFSMSARPAVDLKKGLKALMLKGFLWFAVFGAIFSTGVNAVCRAYSIFELIIIFTLTPVLALFGLKIFNRPINNNEVIYPKYYFSKTRKEYWGAMTGILCSLFLINLIKLNVYSLVFTLICGLFGGIGWVIAQGLQIYLRHYAPESSFKLIRKFSENGFADGWKAMECTLGAIGGTGCAVAFILTYKSFKEITFSLELSGGLLPYDQKLSTLFLIIWIVLLCVDMLHYYVKKPLTTAELKELLTKGKLSQTEYERKVKSSKATTKDFTSKTRQIFESYEFIVYAAIPFILITLGSHKASKIMAFFILFWVLAQEIGFETEYSKKKALSTKLTLSFTGVIILLIQSLFDLELTIGITIILYTIVYEALTLIRFIPEIINNSQNDNDDIDLKTSKLSHKLKLLLKNKSFIVTHLYFVICITLTLYIVL